MNEWTSRRAWIIVGVACLVGRFGGLGANALPEARDVALLATGASSPTAVTWSFNAGKEFPGADGAIRLEADGPLVLEYDFSGGGNYVAAIASLETPLPVQSLAFRVRKPWEATLTVRVVDNTGQTHQKSVLAESADWLAMECRLSGWVGPHWGGADDGEIHQPIRQIALLIERSGLVQNAGAVRFDAIALRPMEPGATVRSPFMEPTYRVTDFTDRRSFQTRGACELSPGLARVDFSQTDQAAIGGSIALLGQPQELELIVEGGHPGNQIEIQLGSHFQRFSRTLDKQDGGVNRFIMPAPPEGWDFGGGQSDGDVRLPLRWVGLTFHKGDGPSTLTAFRLYALRCKTRIPSAEPVTMVAQMGLTGIRWETEKKVRRVWAFCEARNLQSEPIRGLLTMRLLDWDGDELRREERDWILPGLALPARQFYGISIPPNLNFAEATFEFNAEKIETARAVGTFTLPLAEAGAGTLEPDSPWGMGVYLYRYPNTPEGLEQMDHAAAMAQAAGVKWSREEFSWAGTEPARGQFNFEFYDQVVDTAHRHGISVYGLLAYWSRWTEPYTEQGIEDFCAWARVVVRRYKDRIKHWEVYNEPNIFFWKGPRELYPVLLKKCYAAIKEEDPDAQVLGISTAGIDLQFIRQCLDAGAPFDVLTIHPYRQRLVEESFMSELQDVAERVGGRPVWITEMGWSTQMDGVSERDQATLLARTYLAAVASGASQNISWYNFRSDGTDPYYNEHNFGVLRRDLTPKPAYRALATVCRTLDSGAPMRRADFKSPVYAVQMDDALALWTPQEGVSVTCRITEGKPTARNLMGDRISLRLDGDEFTLILKAQAPVFIQGGKIEAVSQKQDTPPTRTETIRF